MQGSLLGDKVVQQAYLDSSVESDTLALAVVLVTSCKPSLVSSHTHYAILHRYIPYLSVGSPVV